MGKRITAILMIYLGVCAAWALLGANLKGRSRRQDRKLKSDVRQLWGTLQRQQAPEVSSRALPANGERANTNAPFHKTDLDASDITVKLTLDHRKRGLLWYSTYEVAFAGTYRVVNNSVKKREMRVAVTLPAEDAIYDNFRFVVTGEEAKDLRPTKGTLARTFVLQPRESKEITLGYVSHGLDEWWYEFGSGVSAIKNFSLVMDTNFGDIDFPLDGISPTAKGDTPDGKRLTWRYSSLLSGVQIGMLMPKKLNPGPWVSTVCFFAPVSLFLFFFLLFLFTTVKEIHIHPMNYFFVAAAFFSYHLLLAYLVDHLSIHIAFWICSLVSIFLVVSYMRLVVGRRFAFVETAISQFVYLVLFSYTFFFDYFTGLAVSILCIITLFVVMQCTGRVDWNALFKKTPPLREQSPTAK